MRKLTRIGLLAAVVFVLGGCHCGYSRISYGYGWGSSCWSPGPSFSVGFGGCR